MHSIYLLRFSKFFFNNRCKLIVESINKGKLYTPYILAKLYANLSIANSYELIPFNKERGIFGVITTPYGERM